MRRLVICAVFVASCLPTFFSSPVSGQTALEKLEQKVREQLGSEAGVGELPSPSQPADDKVPSRSNGQSYLGLEAEEPIGGGIGVRVTAITRQSPAWKAGFEVGDRILAVKGFAIANLANMIEQLGKASPGEPVQFLVRRDGRNKNLTAVLMNADLASQVMGVGTANPGSSSSGPGWLGLDVNDLTPPFRQQFAIPVFRAAAVLNVVNGSPAQKAGIRAGDVVIEANGQPIEGGRGLEAWLSGTHPGERVEMMVYRGSSVCKVDVTLEVSPGVRTSQRPSPAPAQPIVPIPPADDPPISDSSANSDSPTPAIDNPFPPLTSSLPASQVPPSVDDTERASDLLEENQLLRQENQRLQSELESSLQRLVAAEKKLKQIQEALRGSKAGAK